MKHHSLPLCCFLLRHDFLFSIEHKKKSYNEKVKQNAESAESTQCFSVQWQPEDVEIQ